MGVAGPLASQHAAQSILVLPAPSPCVRTDSQRDSVSRAEPLRSLQNSVLRVLTLCESVRWEGNTVLSPAPINSLGDANHHLSPESN